MGEAGEEESSNARARVRSSDQVKAVIRKRDASFVMDWRSVHPNERVNPALVDPRRLPFVAIENKVPAPKPAMEVERMLCVRGEEGRELRDGKCRYVVVKSG